MAQAVQAGKIDREQVLAGWRDRGFDGGLWVDPAGQRWEGYVHDTDELFMVLEGELELELDGVACRPAPGQEVLIAAGTLHSVRNVGRTTARWLYAYAREGRSTSQFAPTR